MFSNIFSNKRHFKVLSSLVVLRVIVILSTYYLARTSFVYSISTGLQGDIIGSGSPVIGVILTFIKIGVILLIEFLFTLKLDDDFGQIEPETSTRLIQANIAVLISEILLLSTLLLELKFQITSLNFVRSIITSASFFAVFSNPSSYLVFYSSIICYIIGMLLYIIPRKSDIYQNSMETIALVLFLRSIFLPM